MKKTAKRLLSLVVTAALMAGLCISASAITYPSKYWPLHDKWLAITAETGPDEVISIAQQTYDLLYPYGLDQDVCYNLEPKCALASWASEIKGDVNGAILWLQRQQELATWLSQNVGGYVDTLQNCAARLEYLELARSVTIYAQTNTAPSAFPVGPRTGTWYGSPADGSRSDGSAVLMYMEFGQGNNADYWFDYYSKTSELFRKAADGGVIELAWNFPGSTAGCQSILSADSYINENLRAMGELDATILLRLGAEMNNWAECDPQAFIQAFQKIASAARQYRNIQIVFSPDMINNRTVTADMYYPGDSYVDWVGMSVYHRSAYSGFNGNTSTYSMSYTGYNDDAYYGQGIYDADPLVGIKHIVNLANAHNKPVMVSECGFPYYNGSQDTTNFAVEQLNKFYSYVNMVYPQVKAVFYFDIPREIEVYHYGLSGSSALNSAYTSAIQNSRTYLSEVDGTAVGWEPLSQTRLTQAGTVRLAAYTSFPNVANPTVQYYVDGNLVSTLTQAPYYLDLDTAALGGGEHTVYAVSSGNQFTAVSPTYTLSVPGGSAPVTPTQPEQPAPEQPTQPGTQQPSGWAKGLIDDALEQGMVTARTEGRYQDQITRLQFAELAVNLIENLTRQEVAPAENTFNDTDDVMVLKAVAAGVASGKGEGTFAPNDFITRQEICVMLSKVIQYVDAAKGSTTLENTSTELDSAKFSDTGDVASWARGAVALLTNNELMSGSDGKVLPKNNTTVEQAIILIRALSYKF